ncbi:DUF1569 domain-containing protein [Algivirga pacifica]|uniref:DUF1569 domain-containing protein n=1 Tax=Algivirga pacifica TaxID=1162670 RepID=A0ABP9D624_9BACT
MQTQLDQIEAAIPYGDHSNVEVSKASVAWHLDHMLKTINKIVMALEKSDPNNFKSSFNFMRSVILTIGKIPRGKAKAPKVVHPPENILTEDLYKQLQIAREKVAQIEQLDKNQHFEHPFFGMLNRKNTKKFIEIHTKHHLAIVHDILKKE